MISISVIEIHMHLVPKLHPLLSNGWTRQQYHVALRPAMASLLCSRVRAAKPGIHCGFNETFINYSRVNWNGRMNEWKNEFPVFFNCVFGWCAFCNWVVWAVFTKCMCFSFGVGVHRFLWSTANYKMKHFAMEHIKPIDQIYQWCRLMTIVCEIPNGGYSTIPKICIHNLHIELKCLMFIPFRLLTGRPLILG